MTGFEPRSAGIRSDHPANRALLLKCVLIFFASWALFKITSFHNFACVRQIANLPTNLPMTHVKRAGGLTVGFSVGTCLHCIFNYIR